jgi:hypothetical protein
MYNFNTFAIFTSQIVFESSGDNGLVLNLKYVFSFGKENCCKASLKFSLKNRLN